MKQQTEEEKENKCTEMTVKSVRKVQIRKIWEKKDK